MTTSMFPALNLRPTLSKQAQADVQSMLKPGGGYLALTKAGDSSVVIHLRVDQIHAYAPVGNEMEVFYLAHVWRVREHFLALQTILNGDWYTIAACLMDIPEHPTKKQVGEMIAYESQIRHFLPGLQQLPDAFKQYNS